MDRPTQEPTIGLVAGESGHARRYAEAVDRLGGASWVISAQEQRSREEVLDRAAGLILCGGVSTPAEGLLALLTAALDADMPLMCMGEGMYDLNLALGGSPPLEIPEHDSTTQSGDRVSSYHRIFITPGSKLAAVVGSGGFVRVNSRHSRGLKEAQKSALLITSAYSLDDGIIEAVESPAHRWVIGVQFHPERRGEIPPHFDRLFQHHVEQAKRHQSTSSRPCPRK